MSIHSRATENERRAVLAKYGMNPRHFRKLGIGWERFALLSEEARRLITRRIGKRGVK